MRRDRGFTSGSNGRPPGRSAGARRDQHGLCEQTSKGRGDVDRNRPERLDAGVDPPLIRGKSLTTEARRDREDTLTVSQPQCLRISVVETLLMAEHFISRDDAERDLLASAAYLAEAIGSSDGRAQAMTAV